QSTPHRHSIFCILPPHMLREMAQNGTPQQRADALQTLTTDQTFRAMRAAQSLPTAPTQRQPSVLAIDGANQRTIFDGIKTKSLAGAGVRTEVSPPSDDMAVTEAYDGLGATFDFYWEAYERNSIDDEGMPLNATVHFGRDYDNAFWDGQRMVFGDGDGQL